MINLIEKRVEKFHKVYIICGIKLKVYSKKLVQKYLDNLDKKIEILSAQAKVAERKIKEQAQQTADNFKLQAEKTEALNNQAKAAERKIKEQAEKTEALNNQAKAAEQKLEEYSQQTVANFKLQSEMTEALSLQNQQNIKQLKNRLANAEGNIYHLREGRYFIWSNYDKLTTAQKIRMFSCKFYKNAGYYLNFKKPRSFNEKLNWLKFNYDDPHEDICSSKYEFKKWIKECLGEEYIVPFFGVYDDVNDIEFDKLPNQFVIKTTSGWGGYGTFVVRDKETLDIDNLKSNFSSYMQEWNSLYYAAFSTSYKRVAHRIIIEEYIEDLEKTDCDYKLFCFNGKVKCFYIANNWATNRLHDNRVVTYYDLEGNPLPFTYGDYQKSDRKLDNVNNFNKMIEIAEKLSKNFPFVRIDFYNLKDRLMLSEMTFRPGGAWGKYSPREWDYKLGEWLDLSKLNPEYLHILPEFAEEAKTFMDPDIVERCRVRNC